MDPEPLLQFIFLALPTATLLQWIIFAVLLLASALISGAEVAFFSLTSSQLEQAKGEEQKNILRIEQLLQKPKRLLATILVANNFINIAIVLFFQPEFELFTRDQNPYFQLFIEVVVITFIILLFGEILPKIYANKNNLRFAQFMAPTLYRLDRYFLFYLTLPMSKLTLFLEKYFGQRSKTFSVDQLSEALEITEQSDTTKEEDKILQGIVSFGNTDTKQVMCPGLMFLPFRPACL